MLKYIWLWVRKKIIKPRALRAGYFMPAGGFDSSFHPIFKDIIRREEK